MCIGWFPDRDSSAHGSWIRKILRSMVSVLPSVGKVSTGVLIVPLCFVDPLVSPHFAGTGRTPCLLLYTVSSLIICLHIPHGACHPPLLSAWFPRYAHELLPEALKRILYIAHHPPAATSQPAANYLPGHCCCNHRVADAHCIPSHSPISSSGGAHPSTPPSPPPPLPTHIS